jgi:di/tricarboxylate transporter
MLALENGFAQATRFKNIVSSRWSLLKYYVVLCCICFLSMWMSNTATAMMMLPIVFSYRSFGRNAWGAKVKFTTAILLGWHMDALLAELLH